MPIQLSQADIDGAQASLAEVAKAMEVAGCSAALAGSALTTLVGDKVFRAMEQARTAGQATHGSASASGERKKLGAQAQSSGQTVTTIDARTSMASSTLYAWQSEALVAWESAGRRGIISAITGAGKTRVAIDAMHRHLARHRKTSAVIVVPTIELLHQWRAAIVKSTSHSVGMYFGEQKDAVGTTDITIFVANSAATSLRQQAVKASKSIELMLVADECHRYGAPTFGPALVGPYQATLGLSATPERQYDDGIERYVMPSLGPVVYEYGYSDALRDGVIAPFEVLAVRLRFTSAEQRQYDQYTDRLGELFRQLNWDYPTLNDQDNPIPFIQKLAENKEPLATAWLSTSAKRKEVLTRAAARDRFVSWLIADGAVSRAEKLIAFHEKIDECERLAECLKRRNVPAAAHHSELNRDQRKRVLLAFAEGKVRAIVAPRTLDEGIDVPDASLAVIVAGSTVRRQAIQRFGRVLRRGDPGKLARLIVLFVAGAGDDPELRLGQNTFMEEMKGLGRGTVAEWPLQQPAIANWLRQTSSTAREHE